MTSVRKAEGAKVDVVDKTWSISNLMWTAGKCCISIIALLVAAGVKLDFADAEKGMTAILLACSGGHEDAAKLLVHIYIYTHTYIYIHVYTYVYK